MTMTLPSTSCGPDVRGVRGQSAARIWKPPAGDLSLDLGRESVDLAGQCGLALDDWQAEELTYAMSQLPDGRWAAFEVGDVVPRQNGKGSKLEARQLAGLVLIDEPLQIHSAHETKTMHEHFRRMVLLIDGAPLWLRKRFKPHRTGSGQETIETKSGCRLRFLARSRGSGRGFSGNVIYLDEAFKIVGGVIAALMPTMSAQPNPQIHYSSSAPISIPESAHLRVVRRRAIEEPEMNPRLAFSEHSIREVDKPTRSTPDREIIRLVAIANPALGIRIDPEFILAEFAAVRSDEDTFDEWCTERLGIPGPEPGAGGQERALDLAAWDAREDRESTIAGTVVLGVDVSPDRQWSSIGAAGKRPDGISWHGEVLAHKPRTGWIVDRVLELRAAHDIADNVVLDVSGPAGSLVAEFEEAGIGVDTVSARGHAAACGLLYDLVTAEPAGGTGVFHTGQKDLRYGVSHADTVPYGKGGAWFWSPEGSVEITPLKAVTLALGAAVGLPPSETKKPTYAF